MADYGLYVENNTGITQIDSTTSDVGYVVTFYSGLTQSIPASEFKPEQGDLLFVKRPYNTNYYYFHIVKEGSLWKFKFWNATNQPGKVPNTALNTGNGALQCVVARPQNLVATNISTGNYGLQIKDTAGKTTFDSRTYNGAAKRFVIETVIPSESTYTSNDSSSDAVLLTAAQDRWVSANWSYSTSSVSNNSSITFGFNSGRLLYYGVTRVDLGPFGGLTNIKVACPSDILIAYIVV